MIIYVVTMQIQQMMNMRSSVHCLLRVTWSVYEAYVKGVDTLRSHHRNIQCGTWFVKTIPCSFSTIKIVYLVQLQCLSYLMASTSTKNLKDVISGTDSKRETLISLFIHRNWVRVGWRIMLHFIVVKGVTHFCKV